MKVARQRQRGREIKKEKRRKDRLTQEERRTRHTGIQYCTAADDTKKYRLNIG